MQMAGTRQSFYVAWPHSVWHHTLAYLHPLSVAILHGKDTCLLLFLARESFPTNGSIYYPIFPSTWPGLTLWKSRRFFLYEAT